MDQKVRTMPIVWEAKGLVFTKPGSCEIRPGLVLPATPFVWVRRGGDQDASGDRFRAHIPADLAPGVTEALRRGDVVLFVFDHMVKEIAVESFDLAEAAEGETLVLLSFTGRFFDAEAAPPETATTLGGS